jgi:hypothetical protein
MRYNSKVGKGYLFICVDSIDRLVKICAVSNIVQFRYMMRHRHPSYVIINDNSPYMFNWSSNLHWHIMNRLSNCKMYEGNKYRTYKLDNYRVQVVIRLLMHEDAKIKGHDVLICERCSEEFVATYDNVRTIAQFIGLDIRYCSDECIPSKSIPWQSRQMYCKCDRIFYPKHSTQFYCDICLSNM